MPAHDSLVLPNLHELWHLSQDDLDRVPQPMLDHYAAVCWVRLARALDEPTKWDHVLTGSWARFLFLLDQQERRLFGFDPDEDFLDLWDYDEDFLDL